MTNPLEIVERLELPPLVRLAGEGALYLGSSGQGLDALKSDPLIKQAAPTSYKKSGFDTAHLTRYDGTDFVQWVGRKRDGMFHPWGPIFEITKDGKRALRARIPSPPATKES